MTPLGEVNSDGENGRDIGSAVYLHDCLTHKAPQKRLTSIRMDCASYLWDLL